MLRVYFVLSASTIGVVWDAAGYWQTTQQVRNYLCTTVGVCRANGVDVVTFGDVVESVAFKSFGVLPVLFGTLFTLVPDHPTSAYLIAAVIDASVCLMVAHIALRLGLPIWLACLAALLHAVHVPSIVQGAAFIQQPLIRFLLATTVWCYTLAFTRTKRRVLLVGFATVAATLLGFCSITTRPLLWIIPGTALVASLSEPHTRSLLRTQMTIGAVVIGGLVGAAVATSTVLPQFTLRESIMRWLVGLSAAGSTLGQITPVSFPSFWAPDAYQLHGLSGTQSLAQDFLHAPGTFVRLWLFSIYSNWRYPDYLYFQKLVLGRRQLQFQHLGYVLAGLLGLSWLFAQQGARKLVALVIFAVAAYMSIAYGLISVEPRRLTVLSPFLALGTACALYSLRSPLGGALRFSRWSAIMVLMWVLVSSLPVSLLLHTGMIAAQSAYRAWVALCAASAAAALAGIVQAWTNADPSIRWWRAAAAPICAIFIAAAGLWRDDYDWRAWSVTTNSRIRQEVDHFVLDPHLQPWLLIDVRSSEQARLAEIYVDGSRIKATDTPMYTWRVVDPSAWKGYPSPYSTLKQMARLDVDLHTWLAYPIPRNLVSASGRLTIDIVPGHAALDIKGDYLDNASGLYAGPSLDPWLTGFSVWRWIWNASDPRIPSWQSLGGQSYGSTHHIGAGSMDRPALQQVKSKAGVYRMFVRQEAFGPDTNAIGVDITERNTAPVACTLDNTLASPPGSNAYLLCRTDAGSINYYSGSHAFLGTSSPDVFKQNTQRYSLLQRIDAEDGKVELIQILDRTFVANIYDTNDKLHYSVGFEYEDK